MKPLPDKRKRIRTATGAWLHWFRAALPPDSGIWVVLLVPLAIGLAASGGINAASSLFVVAVVLMLFIRTLLLRRFAPDTIAPVTLSEIPLAFLIVLICLGGVTAAILVVLFRLWLLLPLGIFSAAVIVFNACAARVQRSRSPVLQLSGLLTLTSTGFSVVYVNQRAPFLVGGAIWLVTFVVFAVSTANCLPTVKRKVKIFFVSFILIVFCSLKIVRNAYVAFVTLGQSTPLNILEHTPSGMSAKLNCS